MKRVMTCVVSALAIGLSAPGCAAYSHCGAAAAGHGVLASAQRALLSTIASSLGVPTTNPPDIGGSSTDSNLDGAPNAMSLDAGNPSASESATTASDRTVAPLPRGNATSRPDHTPQHGARPNKKRPTLTWQSLIPGSIQQ